MLLSGAAGWTGDMFVGMIAIFNNSLSYQEYLKTAIFSYIGCYIGTLLFALLVTGASLPCITPCMNIARYKYRWNAYQMFIRAICGGTFVSFAIFLSKRMNDVCAKYISIWMALSTQVICDYEHCLGTMFSLAVAHINGLPFVLERYCSFVSWIY